MLLGGLLLRVDVEVGDVRVVFCSGDEAVDGDWEFGCAGLFRGCAVDDAECVFTDGFVELEVDVGVAVPVDALGCGLLFGFAVAGVCCRDHGESGGGFFTPCLGLLVGFGLLGL